MNRKTLCMLLALPAMAMAQGYGDMSQADMQKMMKQAQAMQACLAKIDQKQWNELQNRALDMQREVEQLCAADKRDEAQKVAIRYGKEIADAPAMQSVRECGEIGETILKQTSMTGIAKAHEDEERHVCDALQ